jgi:hypothetical protein
VALCAVLPVTLSAEDRLLRVTLDKGLLSLTLRAAPLAHVLEEIGRQSGVSVAVDPSVPILVTTRFEKLPLEDGLRRLLRDANFTLNYRSEGVLSEVRVWPLGTGGGPPRTRPSAAPRGRDADGADREGRGAEAGRPERLRQPAVADTGHETEVLGVLGASDPIARNRVLEALRERMDDRDLPVFLKAVSDNDARVRRSALEALLDLAASSSFDDLPVERLRDVATDDSDSTVRRAAVELLAGIGDDTRDPEALAAVRQAAQDPDPAVRRLARDLDRELSKPRPAPRPGRKPIPDRRG